MDTMVSLVASGNQGALTGAALLAMFSITGGTHDNLAANSGDTNNLGWSFNSGSEAFNFLAVGQSLTLTYTLTSSDGNGGSDTQDVTITVTGTNDGPVANADTDSGHENEVLLIDVLGNDTDADDGAVLTVTAASAPTGQGTASIVGNQVQFDPGTDFDYLDDGEIASVTVNYTIEDEHGAPSSSTIAITVTGTDDAPTLAPVASGSIAEVDQLSSTTAGGLSGSLAGNDVDGEALTYGIGGGGSSSLAGYDVSKAGDYGTLHVNSLTGAYLFVPNAAAIEGLDATETDSDPFTVTVSDGDGPAVSQTYTVNLTGADDAPTLAPVASGSIAEVDQSNGTTSSGLSGTLSGNDVDVEALTYGISGGIVSGDGLTVSKVGAYGTLTVTIASGAYVYTPNAAAIEGLDAGENPSDSFNVTVSDGDGPAVSQTYTVNLTGANEAPTDVLAPTDIKFSLASTVGSLTGGSLAGNATLGSFTAVDGDSTSWTFALSGANAGLFTLSPTTGGSVNLATNAAGIGTGNYTFDVTATDSGGNSYLETFTVSVGSVNADGSVSFTVSSNSDVSFGLNGGDAINGGDGEDALVGGNGTDTLNGGLGNDQLFGGAQSDTFVFNSAIAPIANVDQILDFDAAGGQADKINLENAIFTSLVATGALSATNFAANAGGNAADGNDFILYDTSTGNLYYDADGNGGAATKILIAQLTVINGTVDAGDFAVI